MEAEGARMDREGEAMHRLLRGLRLATRPPAATICQRQKHTATLIMPHEQTPEG
jgi:hypothetical protein